ncbi:MAG: NAD-dependent epimerase/dehydratase family protein [Verrucomicrobia bacterium]|nr:NAD-dependent epimerase/dehydratase family protein [Verrucomicrobiota bacterium]
MTPTIPGRVFISGGSGFLGINLIRYLLDHGIKDIVSLDREPFDYPEADRITAVVGDIRDRATVDRCMDGVTWAVHTAAALPLYKKEEILSVDIGGTKTLLDSAFAHGAQRFIHISSTAVYGIPDHHPLCETDKLVGVGPYGIAKIEAENACLAYRKQGKCVTIIRPKSFVGPERLGVFALLYDWAKDGKNFPMIGSGNNRYQLLDVEDLCDAITRCITRDAVETNDTFNIGAKEFTTMKEDYQAVLDEAGHGKRIIGTPAKPIIWFLRLLELFKLSPLYKWVYETACEDSFVSIEKAERILDWHPQYSNKDALVRNYQWYVENLGTFANQSGVSHRVPWKQGILGFFKLFF